MRYQQYLNEDTHTDFLETCSCIGIICPISLAKNIKNYIDTSSGNTSSLLFEIQQLAGSGNNDWVSNGVSVVKSLNIENDKDKIKIYDCFNLVVGMNIFMKDIGYNIVGKNPHFIHKNINNYYKKEKSIWGMMQHIKANTTDILISSKPDILSSITINSTPDSSYQYMINSDNSTYIQVSLKKDAGQAQLGKVTGFMKSLFSVDKTSSVVDKFLSESIVDYLNTFGSKIKKALNTFSQKIIKKFGKPNKKHLSDLLQSLNLNESTSNKVSMLITKMSDDPSKLINSVNQELSKLINMVSLTNTSSNIKMSNNIQVKNSNDIFKLISNYLTIRMIQDMLKDKTKLSNSINKVMGEMYFGSTKLPLWKVYGYFNSKSYTYMGTIDVYTNKQRDPNIDVFGIKITPTKNYYTITLYMIDNVSHKGKTYVKLRTGTNSSSRISFIVEGTNVIGPYPLNKPLEEII